MILHWKGNGRVGHGILNSEPTKIIYTEWHRIDGFNTYTVFSLNLESGLRKPLLNFRIPDYQWQHGAPSIFNEQIYFLKCAKEEEDGR